MRNPILVGERLYLRPLEASDAEQLAATYATEVATFMERGRMPYSPLEFARWIEQLHARQPPRNIDFAVCLKADDRFIGYNGLSDIDYVEHTAESESDFGPEDVRNRGYGTEAKHLLLEYAFDRLHLHAVHSFVWEPNARSAAALIKQGYRPAGRLKWNDVKAGVYRDTLVFDILRADWIAARDAWRAGQAGAGGR